jgi:hypothetical protein
MNPLAVASADLAAPWLGPIKQPIYDYAGGIGIVIGFCPSQAYENLQKAVNGLFIESRQKGVVIQAFEPLRSCTQDKTGHIEKIGLFLNTATVRHDKISIGQQVNEFKIGLQRQDFYRPVVQ